MSWEGLGRWVVEFGENVCRSAFCMLAVRDERRVGRGGMTSLLAQVGTQQAEGTGKVCPLPVVAIQTGPRGDEPWESTKSGIVKQGMDAVLCRVTIKPDDQRKARSGLQWASLPKNGMCVLDQERGNMAMRE
jgi:hypothetical protein